MPNIGTVLKEEIVRLSRKESRRQIDPTKKTTTQLPARASATDDRGGSLRYLGV